MGDGRLHRRAKVQESRGQTVLPAHYAAEYLSHNPFVLRTASFASTCQGLSAPFQWTIFACFPAEMRPVPAGAVEGAHRKPLPGSRHPLLVEWADGRRDAVLFALEEESDWRRFSAHRLAHISTRWPPVTG